MCLVYYLFFLTMKDHNKTKVIILMLVEVGLGGIEAKRAT
jgi:hypothetical protein